MVIFIITFSCNSPTKPTAPPTNDTNIIMPTNNDTNVVIPTNIGIAANTAAGTVIHTVRSGCSTCPFIYTLNPVNGANGDQMMNVEIIGGDDLKLTGMNTTASAVVVWGINPQLQDLVLIDRNGGYINQFGKTLSSVEERISSPDTINGSNPSIIIISNITSGDIGAIITTHILNQRDTTAVALTIQPLYAITGGNTDGFFEMNVTNGELSIANSPIMAGDYDLTIEYYTNQNTPTSTTSVTIEVE